MAYISTEITQSISDEIECISQDVIDRFIEHGYSQRAFLFSVYYTMQSHRRQNYFGDGIGTRGTFTLDVKDEHIYTMLKAILKIKGYTYKHSSK